MNLFDKIKQFFSNQEVQVVQPREKEEKTEVNGNISPPVKAIVDYINKGKNIVICSFWNGYSRGYMERRYKVKIKGIYFEWDFAIATYASAYYFGPLEEGQIHARMVECSNGTVFTEDEKKILSQAIENFFEKRKQNIGEYRKQKIAKGRLYQEAKAAAARLELIEVFKEK